MSLQVRRREAELARMRSLLFYHELKLKRVAKIKSKTFRKIHKKHAERHGGGDDDDVEDDDDDEVRRCIQKYMRTREAP